MILYLFYRQGSFCKFVNFSQLHFMPFIPSVSIDTDKDILKFLEGQKKTTSYFGIGLLSLLPTKTVAKTEK